MVPTLWQRALGHAANSIVLAILLTSVAAAEPPASSNAPAPPGLLNKLGQKTKSLFSRSPAPPAQSAAQSSGVKQATWNQPAPPPLPKGKGKRGTKTAKQARPPRTMSEYMAQERP